MTSFNSETNLSGGKKDSKMPSASELKDMCLEAMKKIKFKSCRLEYDDKHIFVHLDERKVEMIVEKEKLSIKIEVEYGKCNTQWTSTLTPDGLFNFLNRVHKAICISEIFHPEEYPNLSEEMVAECQQWLPKLNDEAIHIINVYMELLAERSRSNDKLPKVHDMKPCFLKSLLETGYSGAQVWTRTVDIFAHDIILVPFHKDDHWCIAIIHLKNKTIKYYDPKGAQNDSVLSALAKYLKSESLDKKKTEFDMAGWKLENVRNIPQQENGSDCGVLSCMYAEFVTRNRPIVFTQQDLQYFRIKTVYEYRKNQLLKV